MRVHSQGGEQGASTPHGAGNEISLMMMMMKVDFDRHVVAVSDGSAGARGRAGARSRAPFFFREASWSRDQL